MQLTGTTLAAAKDKLNSIIAQGRENQATVIETLIRESNERRDILTGNQVLRFVPQFRGGRNGGNTKEDGYLQIGFDSPDLQGSFFNFTDWSMSQLSQKLSVPANFLEGLIKEMPMTAAELLMDLRGRMDSKFLVRTVGNETRAILSDKYKNIDQQAIAANFIQACQSTGAIPLDGSMTDRRFILRAIIGDILEPFPGEPIILGVQVSSSDYGASALNVNLIHMRIWCTNLAVGESSFKQIHSGKAIEGTEGEIDWSDKTRKLSQDFIVSSMRDSLDHVLSKKHRDIVEAKYTEAANTSVNSKTELDKLRKQNILRKAEAENLHDLILNERRAEILPNTENPESKLRVSQALAWLAQSVKGERALELQTAAGKYM